MGTLGTQIARTASESLARYRLQSRRGKTLTLHFRVYQPGSSSALQPLHVLPDVAQGASFEKLLAQMRSKCHLPVSVEHRGGSFSDARGQDEFIVIYRSHRVELTDTPATLALPSGAIVHLVARKWWDLTRRTEARRGLLSSQRPQDALVRSLVVGTESKVKQELRATGAIVNSVYTGEESPQLARMKRSLAGSTSNSSFLSSPSGSIGLSKSASQLSMDQDEDSLSVLLCERAAAGREKERRAADSNHDKDLSAENESGTPTLQHELPMVRLDEAWVELAALTASVRVATERLAQLRQAAQVTEELPKLSAQQLHSLENEWRARVRSTEVLSTQTKAAHKLAKQMLDQIRPRRAPSSGGGERNCAD